MSNRDDSEDQNNIDQKQDKRGVVDRFYENNLNLKKPEGWVPSWRLKSSDKDSADIFEETMRCIENENEIGKPIFD